MKHRIVVLFILFLSGCGTDYDGQALGTIERDRITLSATASETITRVLVSEGQRVEAGTVLLELDDSKQCAAVERAQAEVELFTARLEELVSGPRQQEIAAARARLDAAKASQQETDRQWLRIQRIFKEGAVGEAEYDRAKQQKLTADAMLSDAREKLSLLEVGTRSEQLSQAKAQLHAAQAQLAIEQNRLSDLKITSQRAGTISDLPWHRGERVAAGSVVVIMMADALPYARVYLPQKHRAHYRVGDPVQVNVDGYDQVFQGKIRSINNEPAFTPFYAINEKERSRLVYLTEVQLSDTAAELPSGLTAQVLLHD